MFVGEDHILTKIESSDFEKEILEGENINEKSNNSNGRLWANKQYIK